MIASLRIGYYLDEGETDMPGAEQQPNNESANQALESATFAELSYENNGSIFGDRVLIDRGSFEMQECQAIGAVLAPIPLNAQPRLRVYITLAGCKNIATHHAMNF